jgi:hypothetical protein
MSNSIAFKKTNAVAQRWENEVFIIALNDNSLKYGFKWESGYHPEYDIKLFFNDGSQRKIEVKGQTIYDSKNDYFTIEYLQKGKASGLDKTDADYYYIFKYERPNKEILEKIYYDYDLDPIKQDTISYTLYKIKTKLIRQVIRKNENIPISTYNDSNQGKNESYKIPINYFTNFGSVEILTGNLNADEYDNLLNDSVVDLNSSNKIFYANDKQIDDLKNNPPDLKTIGNGRYKNGDSSGSSSESEEERQDLRTFYKKLTNKIKSTKK